MPKPALVALGSALFLLVGCYETDEQKTIKGLQEESKIHKRQILDLTNQVASLKAENETAKARLEADFRNSLTRVLEMHRQETAGLEQKIADLRLELATVIKEKMTLDEMLGRQPRLQEAVKGRFGVERLAWIALFVAALVALGVVAVRYFQARAVLSQIVVRRAASLMHAEGGSHA